MAILSLTRRGIAVLLIFGSIPLNAATGKSSMTMTTPLPLYPSVTGAGLAGCLMNQAALASIRSPSAGVSLLSRFCMKELSVRSIFAAFPAGTGSLGFRYSAYGFSEMMYHSAGISGGMKLSSSVSLGVEAGVEVGVSPGTTDNLVCLTGQTGIIWQITENTALGLHLVNPMRPALRNSGPASSIRAGAGTAISERLMICAVIEKRSGLPLSLATGLEYDISGQVTLRTGFDSATGSFGLSAGFRFAGFASEFMFLTNSRLGVSPGIRIFKTFGR